MTFELQSHVLREEHVVNPSSEKSGQPPLRTLRAIHPGREPLADSTIQRDILAGSFVLGL